MNVFETLLGLDVASLSKAVLQDELERRDRKRIQFVKTFEDTRKELDIQINKVLEDNKEKHIEIKNVQYQAKLSAYNDRDEVESALVVFEMDDK